jgi:HEPN domain-containing protein
MKTDETNPQDWFCLARERLAAADAVRQACGAGSSAVELLQEAVERYLKGFLIASGWPLQKIHNLSTLLDAAIQRDARFREYADLCESLTAQFWEQHYPGGDLTEVGADYDQLRQQLGEMLILIPGASAPPPRQAELQ